MTLHELKQKYHKDIVNYMLDVLYDTPTSDLIEDLLHWIPVTEIDNWALKIQEDFTYSDEVNHAN
jgi:hypothetical protein